MLVGLTLAEDTEDQQIKVGMSDTGLINILKGTENYFVLLVTDKGMSIVSKVVKDLVNFILFCRLCIPPPQR